VPITGHRSASKPVLIDIARTRFSRKSVPYCSIQTTSYEAG